MVANRGPVTNSPTLEMLLGSYAAYCPIQTGQSMYNSPTSYFGVPLQTQPSASSSLIRRSAGA